MGEREGQQPGVAGRGPVLRDRHLANTQEGVQRRLDVGREFGAVAAVLNGLGAQARQIQLEAAWRHAANRQRLRFSGGRLLRQARPQASRQLVVVVHHHGGGQAAVVQRVNLAGKLRCRHRQRARQSCFTVDLEGVVAQTTHQVGNAFGDQLVNLGCRPVGVYY